MAGQFYTGTLLASPIVRGSSGDTYGTHHSILGVGGFMEVNNLTERNLLPIDTVNGIMYDGISSGQRRLGMLVYVHADDTVYQLKVAQATWSGLTSAGQLTALANNSNWVVFVGGGDVAGDKIEKPFVQTTNGFVVGDVIGYNGADFVKVSNLTAATVEPLGIVSEVSDADNFKLTFSGYISTTSILDVNSSGLTGGTTYYLSDVAGKITDVQPSGNTNINKPVLVALASGDNGIVLQYRGIYDNIGTLSYDLFTGYTATTQVFLDKTVTGATNLGYFTGQTGLQTLPINHLTNDLFDGNYVSLYNNYYRDAFGYIRIGAASDGIKRRGYLRQPTVLSPTYKSWLWNEYTGDTAQVGWLFINNDISSDAVYGTMQTGSTYMEYSVPEYTANTWTEGQFYNNGSQVVVDTVLGDTITGATYDEGGPIYRDKVDQELRLRTVVSNSPSSIKVEYDDYFIKLSGHSSLTTAVNVGTGVGLYSGTTGSTLLLKTLVGSGTTVITDKGDHIVIYSSGSGSTTGGTIGGSGENVTKRLTQVLHGFSTGEVIGFSGGTYNKAIADGTYDGEIIGIVTNVISTDVFDLTQSGYVTGLTGFVSDSTYFVSPIVEGGLTATTPTTIGYLVKAMFLAESATSGWVLPYMGYYITPPVTGGTTGGTEIFTEDIVVSIDVGKSFGRYLNGDTIPATGLTPKEVIILACFEGKDPTVSLSSSLNDVAFGESGKTVNLNFSYTINTLNASVSTTLLEWRRGGSGVWVTLVSDTGATNYTHNIDDSLDRFDTDVLNYRYTVVDSEGMTGVTTHDVTPQAYQAPTITSTLNGTVTSPETQTNREVGNVDSLINGSIVSTRSLVNITDWTLERQYDGGGYIVLTSGSGLSTLSVSIPSYNDNVIPASADIVNYRITYVDEYTSGTGGAKTINMGYFNYAGLSTNTVLSSAQIIALGDEAFATSTSKSHDYTTAINEYAFYAYPATYADLTTITMLDNGGGSPIDVFGAFQKLSNVTVTNSHGEAASYKVYRSNAPGAFSTDIVTFS